MPTLHWIGKEKVILSPANLDNVVFWHRNPERGKGFAINGFKNNHLILIYIQKGTIILLESKGDERNNSDSIAKNKLGKNGQNWPENNTNTLWYSTTTTKLMRPIMPMK